MARFDTRPSDIDADAVIVDVPRGGSLFAVWRLQSSAGFDSLGAGAFAVGALPSPAAIYTDMATGCVRVRRAFHSPNRQRTPATGHEQLRPSRCGVLGHPSNRYAGSLRPPLRSHSRRDVSTPSWCHTTRPRGRGTIPAAGSSNRRAAPQLGSDRTYLHHPWDMRELSTGSTICWGHAIPASCGQDIPWETAEARKPPWRTNPLDYHRLAVTSSALMRPWR